MRSVVFSLVIFQDNSMSFAHIEKMLVVAHIEKTKLSILPHEAKYMSWLFCLWQNTNCWNGHVTITIQRHTTCWGLKLRLSLFFTQYRQTATKSLVTLNWTLWSAM